MTNPDRIRCVIFYLSLLPFAFFFFLCYHLLVALLRPRPHPLFHSLILLFRLLLLQQFQGKPKTKHVPEIEAFRELLAELETDLIRYFKRDLPDN